MSKVLQQGLIPFLSLVIYLTTIQLDGQVSLQTDTLKIGEVVITRKQISSEQPGFKFYIIDSSGMEEHSHLFLNDILRDATPLFIKEYGAGLTATSSFRGTSAGHTQVMWNGININDPMLGQTDFSLIPSGMVDNVLVSFGGASMDLGSGAIGGVINLGNEPSWKKETIIDIAPGTGSFGRYTGFARISTGNQNFHTITKAFMNSADYDFRYLDSEAVPEPQWKTRDNNGMLRKSLMQELYFRKSGNVFSARLWYQSSSRNLPGSIQYGYLGEKQSDESLRSLISYDALKGKNEFFTQAAWMITDMHYKSIFDTIGSKNKVNTMILKGGMTFPLGESAIIKIVLNDELNIVESNNYENSVNHNNASLTVSAEKKKGKWFGAAILLRQTIDDKKLLIPDFSTGFEVRTIRGEEHYIKLNLSRNSKIPSLNDRFWNPGGNPDLKNEYAYSIEAGYKLEHIIGSTIVIGSELNYFNNYIRNMIHWVPDEMFFWSAENAGSVNSTGLESAVSVKYNLSDFSVNFNAGYSYTNARDITSPEYSDKQLIYVPKHQANGSLRLSYKNIYSSWITNFTGSIFTTSNNTGFIKDCTINSISGGYKLNFKNNYADLRIKIENIFNVSYQTIAYYPQPGRSYFLVLSLRFKA